MDHLIKRIINETLIEKFFDSMFSDLNLDNLESMVIRDNRSVHKTSVGYYTPDLNKMVFRVVEPFKSSYWDSDDPQSRIRPIQKVCILEKTFIEQLWILSLMKK